MNIKNNIILSIILFSAILYAYDPIDFFNKKTMDFSHYSSEIDSEKHDSSSVKNDENGKNQFLAMGLSAIIPGAGQIYNGDWKRGVAYLGIELILWSYRENYNDKGDMIGWTNWHKQTPNRANDAATVLSSI